MKVENSHKVYTINSVYVPAQQSRWFQRKEFYGDTNHMKFCVIFISKMFKNWNKWAIVLLQV